MLRAILSELTDILYTTATMSWLSHHFYIILRKIILGKNGTE